MQAIFTNSLRMSAWSRVFKELQNLSGAGIKIAEPVSANTEDANHDRKMIKIGQSSALMQAMAGIV